MFFELQLSKSVFTRIIRNRLKAQKRCVDREFSFNVGQNTIQLAVDRVEIGESTELQREQTLDKEKTTVDKQVWKSHCSQHAWIFSTKNYTSYVVPYLQIKQEVLIHLVQSSDLDANGPKATPPFLTLTIFPVFNISLQSIGKAGAGGPLLMSYSLAHIDYDTVYRSLTEQQRKDIHDEFAKFQLPPSVVDLGKPSGLLPSLAGINAGITCDSSGTFVAMRADFDVSASDPAVSVEFFEEGSENVLAGHDWAMLVDGNAFVEYGTEKAKDALGSLPKTKLYGEPDVRWDASGPAIDINAEMELFDACPLVGNMDAEVNIRVSFSVPSPDILRRHYNISGHPSDRVEEFACALTGAVLWPFLGPVLLKDEAIGAAIGAYLVGFGLGPLLRFIGIVAAIETKTLEEDISKTLGATCHKLDDKNYQCDDPMAFLVRLSPPFTSRLELNHIRGVAQGLVMAGFVRNLTERQEDHVSIKATPFRWTVWGDCRSGFGIVNQAQIQISSTRDDALCEKNTEVLDGADSLYELVFADGFIIVRPKYKPAVATGLRPCRVRLVTTGGVRTITLPPPAALVEAEQTQLTKIRDSLGKYCRLAKDSMTKPVEWKITKPGPGEEPGFEFWQFVVQGLRPGERMRISHDEGSSVLTATASATGEIQAAAMFRHDRAPSHLSLELDGTAEPGAEAHLAVQQLRYERRATMATGRSLRSLRFEGSSGKRRLVIEDDKYESTWDVNVPAVPALLQSTMHTSESEAGGMLMHTGRSLEGSRVDGLRERLERLREQYGAPHALGSPRTAGVAQTLYIRSDRHAVLLDVSDPEQARPIQIYTGPAWYEGVALGWNLMARHDAERGSVELYVVTASETV